MQTEEKTANVAPDPSGEPDVPKSNTPRAGGAESRLRQFFMMSEALREAEQRAFRSPDPGWHAYQLAKEAVESGEALRDFPERKGAQLLMMRDAAVLAVRATVERASGANAEPGADLWESFSSLPQAEPLLKALGDECKERVRHVVGDGNHQRIAELQGKERTAWLKDVSDFTTQVLEPLVRDAEATARVRTASALRISVALVVILALVASLVYLVWPSKARPNLALDRPVTISSNYDTKRFPASSAVDGIVGELGCHTKREKRPWLRIDLGAVMEVQEVVVYNRDSYKDRAVPLLIEVSEDGRRYAKYAERKDTFDVWKAKKGEATVRYVRLTALKNPTVLNLNEVQVY